MSLPGEFEIIPISEIPDHSLAENEHIHHPVVLVVDNDPVIADTRAAILRSWGYAPITAYDAESAFETAAIIPPEMYIGDVAMTRANGANLAAEIRMSVPDCKMVLFSDTINMIELRTAAESRGQNFIFLKKPVHPLDLSAHFPELGHVRLSIPISAVGHGRMKFQS